MTPAPVAAQSPARRGGELDAFFEMMLTGPGAARVEPAHVRFLVDAPSVPFWIADCVERTASIPGVHVSLDIAKNPSPARKSPAWRSWTSRSAALQDLPAERFAPTAGAPSIILNCSSNNDIPGAWWFALDGRQRIHPDMRELFLHAARQPRAIDLSLRDDTRAFASLRASPWDGIDWQRHAATLQSAAALILLALTKRGDASAAAPAFSPMPEPGAYTISRFAASKTLRSMKARVTGSDIAAGWKIAFREQHLENFQRVPASGWRWIQGFPGHQAADPFLVEDGSQLWLFYEDMVPPTGFGRLAVMDARNPNAQPKVILEKPYHLSYPYVFQHDGQWWMIPESGANRTVDLYRASNFPFDWVHERTLISGHRFADTTPIFHNGLWYFFTSTWLAGRAQCALLFTADSLLAPWRLHPSSPLTMDPAEARGAGPIFRQEGRLYRPVQDCLTKYGYAMSFREIVELTPTVCRERKAGALLPDWHPGLEATHTFCQSSSACVIDGQLRA